MPDEYASGRARLQQLAKNRMKSPYGTNLGRSKSGGPMMSIRPPGKFNPIKGRATNLGKSKGGKPTIGFAGRSK